MRMFLLASRCSKNAKIISPANPTFAVFAVRKSPPKWLERCSYKGNGGLDRLRKNRKGPRVSVGQINTLKGQFPLRYFLTAGNGKAANTCQQQHNTCRQRHGRDFAKFRNMTQ